MMSLSQIQIIAAIAAEIDRQYPGATVNENAMNAIIAAADAVVAAQGDMTLPEPVENRDDEAEAEKGVLDSIPGWEAA